MSWQPIATAPKDDVVIVWNGDFITLGKRYRSVWLDYADEGVGFDDQPTHWMPLPEPPK